MRFVAPDLSDDENGEQKFSVQSYLVTPEELMLLKPTHTWTTTPESKGELSIDAKMLRQLSEAGMTIGRQIETSAVDIVLQSTKNANVVKKFGEKFAVSDAKQIEILEKLFEKIKVMVNSVLEKTENGVIDLTLKQMLVNGSTESNGISHATMNGHSRRPSLIEMLSATIIDCVMSMKNANVTTQKPCQSQQQNASLYEIISKALAENAIACKAAITANGNCATADDNENDVVLTDVLRAIDTLLTSSSALEQLEQSVNETVKQTIRISKVDLIASTINKNIYNDAEILNNVCAILQGENEEDMIEAIRELFENEPKILYRIMANVKSNADHLTNDVDVIETVKRCVITAVKESVATEIRQIVEMANVENPIIDEYLMQTVALAKALGLSDVAENILNAMHATDRTEIKRKLQADANIMDLLERVVVMNKLARNNVERQEALSALRSDPYGARKDARIRELLRRSSICVINPIEKAKITDSNEVPISLFCSDNQLAMEDFLIRRQAKSRGAFLIVKEGLQAVVPRELSRDVLLGKCAYTVLDENGIRHFEPLHVFSALKLNIASLSSHRFSLYSCDFANGEENNGHTEKPVEKLSRPPLKTLPISRTKSTNTVTTNGSHLINGCDRSKSFHSNYCTTDSLSSYSRRQRFRDAYYYGKENQVNWRHSYYF